MKTDIIYNENCLEGIKRIASKSIKLIVTDPPYFMGLTHNGQKGSFNDLLICKPFYDELAKELKRVLTDDGEFYIFSDWRGYAFYYPIFNTELPIRNLIVWDKISGPGNFYRSTHELIIYGCLRNNTRKSSGNIWREKAFCSGAKTTNGEKVHPTQKPVELIERIILDGSQEMDTVLDCFMGSGTTAIAAINTRRKFIGFELDGKYYDIACNRISEHAL